MLYLYTKKVRRIIERSTSIVSKVCEKIVRKNLVTFWISVSRNVFTSDQFGFMKGKSCLSQMLHVFNDWAHERNTGKQHEGTTTDIIFLDLSKAFDSVPRVRLITKMKACGIQGPLLSWLNELKSPIKLFADDIKVYSSSTK